MKSKNQKNPNIRYKDEITGLKKKDAGIKSFFKKKEKMMQTPEYFTLTVLDDGQEKCKDYYP